MPRRMNTENPFFQDPISLYSPLFLPFNPCEDKNVFFLYDRIQISFVLKRENIFNSLDKNISDFIREKNIFVCVWAQRLVEPKNTRFDSSSDPYIFKLST